MQVSVFNRRHRQFHRNLTAHTPQVCPHRGPDGRLIAKQERAFVIELVITVCIATVTILIEVA